MTIEEFQVTLISSEMDLPISHGILNGTFAFVSMGTVGKLALGDVGTELDEVAFDLGGIDSPEFELAEAGGVDDVTAGLESNEFGTAPC